MNIAEPNTIFSVEMLDPNYWNSKYEETDSCKPVIISTDCWVQIQEEALKCLNSGDAPRSVVRFLESLISGIPPLTMRITRPDLTINMR